MLVTTEACVGEESVFYHEYLCIAARCSFHAYKRPACETSQRPSRTSKMSSGCRSAAYVEFNIWSLQSVLFLLFSLHDGTR